MQKYKKVRFLTIIFVLFWVPAISIYLDYDSLVEADFLLGGFQFEVLDLEVLVAVNKGTTPQNPTNIGPAYVTRKTSTGILMNYDSNEFTANFSAPVSPTGAWATFYQTLPTTGATQEVPYEIRCQQVNPYTGEFEDPIALSTGQIYVGTYSNGSTIALTADQPAEGAGGYKVALDAYQFARAYTTITDASINPVPLQVQQGLSSNTLSGALNAPSPNLSLDTGYILASRDGLVVDAINVGTTGTNIAGSGGTYLFAALPGGSASSPLPGAFYTLYGLGWKSSCKPTTLSVAMPRVLICVPGMTQ